MNLLSVRFNLFMVFTKVFNCSKYNRKIDKKNLGKEKKIHKDWVSVLIWDSWGWVKVTLDFKHRSNSLNPQTVTRLAYKIQVGRSHLASSALNMLHLWNTVASHLLEGWWTVELKVIRETLVSLSYWYTLSSGRVVMRVIHGRTWVSIVDPINCFVQNVIYTGFPDFGMMID